MMLDGMLFFKCNDEFLVCSPNVGFIVGNGI
jgi:hypothetical protein